MKRVWLALGCALVIAVGAGCGGGGSENASTPQTSTAPAPLTPRQKAQVALRRYLAQSRTANGFYQRGRSTANRSEDDNRGARPGDPRLKAAAKGLRAAAAQTAEASIRQRLATPPRQLKRINVNFARDMGRRSDYYDDLAGYLDADNVTGYNASSSDSGGAVRNEWRLQIQAECRRLGVPFPSWAKVIGKIIPAKN